MLEYYQTNQIMNQSHCIQLREVNEKEIKLNEDLKGDGSSN